MARDPNSSMITSPWSNSGDFFQKAINKIVPNDSGKKLQTAVEPIPPNVIKETVKEVVKEVKPVSKEQRKLFKEMIKLLSVHAELDSMDATSGIAVFETKDGSKIRLEML